MRVVTLDLETKNTFADVGARDTTLLDLSIVSIHDSETNSLSSYLEEDLGKLWAILERTDVLVGFNSEHFDIPILNKYYTGNLHEIKSIDLLAEIRNSLGRRIGLDAIAEATLGVRKSGHGLQAIEWWKNGEISKLREYCENDVKVTRALYDYALANQALKYKSEDGIRSIPIDTRHWLESNGSSLTFTLPL